MKFNKEQIKEITNGDRNGERVWVCDLRFNNHAEKPIRNIKPIEVEVRCNTEIKQNVYYSQSHLRPLNKKGGILKKIIKVYDNTGYQSYRGVALNIFDNEQECIEHFEEQKEEAIDGIQKIREELDQKISDIEKM